MELSTIGYDAKRAALNSTGLGNYSRQVIDLVSHALPNTTLKLYTPRDGMLKSEENRQVITPQGFWKHFSSAWRLEKGITKHMVRNGVKLFHGLSGELPLDIRKADIPTVVTIHDVIFRRLPRCYKAVDRAFYDYKFGQAVRNATRVMAISHCTANDIIEFYHVDPDKIDIVYQSCHPQFFKPVGSEEIKKVRERFHLPERYIIALATLEQRKNQRLAISALRGLPKDVCLVLAGRPRDREYYRELIATIAKHDVGDRVKFLNEIPFDILPGLYGGSIFASYTSRYEGFGLPVVEAILSGVPVIAATGSCLEEAGGRGAIYVNPDDVDQYIEEARRLIYDPSLRAGMVRAGREHAARFSGEAFVKDILSCYDRAVEQNNMRSGAS